MRDLARSERAAAAVDRGPARALCEALQRERPAALPLAAGFRGRWLVDGPVEVDDPAVQVVGRLPSGWMDAQAFGAAVLADRRGALTVVRRCSVKTVGFRLAPEGGRAWASQRFEISGLSPEGPRVLRGAWRARLVRVGEAWRYAALAPTRAERVTTRAPAFTDISGAVGVSWPRAPLTEAALRTRADALELEQVGGLAVLDWDRDGFDDLLAWHEGHALRLFRNDGRGGFEAGGSLLPPEAVGLFQLTVDLDGDGVEEVVSTAVGRCTSARAELGLYRRVGEALVAVPGGLPFQPADCVDFRRALYPHVLPLDLEGDGDLDLVVSGYTAGRTGGHLNKFRTDEGRRTLLFLNEGGLRFREVGRERGLVGTAPSYVATTFDVNRDGRPDLFIANDFGPNAVYLSAGEGRFTVAPPGPMTAPGSGQSMGLTVTDLDGDGALDLYVSRMYSKAGHRVVPLAADRLRPESRAALEALAAGNALWSWGPEGWRDRAAELGVAVAGWAWGQAAADLDNDGDRDIYVVNGMLSNARAGPGDY